MLDTKHIAYCCNHASIPEIVASIDHARRLRDAASYTWLHDFVVAEKAGKNRKSIIARVVEILADWGKEEGAEGSEEVAAVIDGHAEVLPGVRNLDDIKAALEETRERLTSAEQDFLNNTLADRLKIGLRCYQAHLLFAVGADDRNGVGGRGRKTLSSRDTVSFESWITNEIPWLKRPTAYRYMTAFRGLGLSEKATEEQVAFTLETLRHANQTSGLPAPSLASLAAAAVDRLAPPAPEPAPAPTQLSFDDYLTTLRTFREDSELVIEQAKEMPDHLRKQAAARAYATLSALTGSPWQPADTHDALADVDPDSIAL